MSFSIKFIGATETVTGSCFLVTAGDTKFLVDTGMYQGPDVEHRNLEPFPFDASEVDFVLLTHAHLDHVGLLPKLTRHGFTGKVFCTLHTSQIGEIVLRDSAKIQESNFSRGVAWKFAGEVALVYDAKDAEDIINNMEVIRFDEEFNPVSEITVTARRAGHILGAASYEVEYNGKVVVFSGDIGRTKQDLIPGFSHNYSREVDYVLMESLYGGKVHPRREESVNELITAIRETTDKGGSVYIPCFAVQRSQEILNDIKLAKQGGALRDEMPVWLDSPMAQRVTRVYGQALDHSGDSPFSFPGFNYIRKHKQSEKISKRNGQVIIAGSGMAEGGRIMNHIRGNISNPKNTFIFVGYQAEETLGRSITEGATDINVDDMPIKVKAKIMHLQGFSAHGDTEDYENWLARYNSDRLKRTFLIHADGEALVAMKQTMEDKKIDHPYIPSRDEVIEL